MFTKDVVGFVEWGQERMTSQVNTGLACNSMLSREFSDINERCDCAGPVNSSRCAFRRRYEAVRLLCVSFRITPDVESIIG